MVLSKQSNTNLFISANIQKNASQFIETRGIVLFILREDKSIYNWL